MKNITVIGAGTMGNGIAQVFAQTGYKVILNDISNEVLEKAIQNIKKNLDRLIEKDKLQLVDKENCLQNLTTSSDTQKAVANADLVIEAATEKESIKLKIFTDVDQWAPPDCILASNTSAISITRIAAATNRPEKVIGMHFMNPVPMMKLVEVIKGFNTSDEVCSRIMDLCRNINKVPVEVIDLPGFVANRILMPLINESIFAVYERVAGVAEIDTVMKLGMAHPMGPLQLADFIGLDVVQAILNVLMDGFGNPKYSACPLLSKMVDAKKLGVKTGEGFYVYTPGSKEIIVSPHLNWRK